jgi:hypothetical protein
MCHRRRSDIARDSTLCSSETKARPGNGPGFFYGLARGREHVFDLRHTYLPKSRPAVLYDESYTPPRTMAYERHFIKDAKKGNKLRTHVRMIVDGSMVLTDELQEGAATDPGAVWKPLRAQACDGDFEALAYADGQEFMRLTKGGWRLAAADGAPLSEGGDILSLRPRNPGPLAVLTAEGSYPSFDWYDYFEYAVSRIGVVWAWDDPEAAMEWSARMTHVQMALWAIANADGQICNGGFSQFFYNSYGELAHEALAGFELLGMAPYADILREAYAVFPGQRIPKDRDERVALLETMARDDEATAARLRAASNGIEHASAIFKGTEDLWVALEAHYCALIHQDIGVRGYNVAFYKPLCECIESHAGGVFR